MNTFSKRIYIFLIKL